MNGTSEETTMRPYGRPRRWKVLKVLAIVPLAIGATGYVVMSLWNWLVPPITGWHALGFLQALGLFVLCRILFGGLRGGGWRRGMHRRFDAMTPEERERLREGLRRRWACGRDRAPGAP